MARKAASGTKRQAAPKAAAPAVLRAYTCPTCGGTSQLKDTTLTCPYCAAVRPSRRDAAAGSLERLELGGTIAIRDDAGGPDGRTVEGVAVRYNTRTMHGATVEFPGMAEEFAPGAFADVIARRGERPFPLIDRHDGTPIGAIRFHDGPDALRYSGRLLGTAAARDFAEQVAAGVDGVSLEFVIGEFTRNHSERVISHRRVRAIAALAGSYAPAYEGAVASVRSIGGHQIMEHCRHCGAELAAGAACTCVGAVAEASAATSAAREQANVTRMTLAPDQVQHLETVARAAAEDVVRRSLEAGAGQSAPDPFAPYRSHRSLGTLVQAAIQPGATLELRSYASRALADQLTTDTNTGVTGHSVIREVAGIVSRGRRAITAFGGPRQLSGSGMTMTWPYYDGTLTDLIGAQSAEKTEITSAKVQIKQGSEAIQTFAGGSDISYQLLRRSDPSYLDIYIRILLLAYGVVTDAAFVTELESGSTTVDFAEALTAVDATELKNHLITAALAVETATGAPADFVLASTTAFAAAAKLLTPAPVTNAIGTVDIAGLRVNVGGLPVIHVPSITAGKLIVSNREAAGFYEDGPFQASDEDVAKLGRNVAIWGMAAPVRLIPAGIVEVYDVTP